MKILIFNFCADCFWCASAGIHSGDSPDVVYPLCGLGLIHEHRHGRQFLQVGDLVTLAAFSLLRLLSSWSHLFSA